MDDIRGCVACDLWPAAVDEARRRLKPGIPMVGESGVRVCDELELELVPGREAARR